MNKFSRNDENQAVFMAWFNALSADVKLAYLEAYEAGTLDVPAVLTHGGQDVRWTDTLIDQLFTFGDAHQLDVARSVMSLDHMMAWCTKQNFGFDEFNAMLDKANEDLEFWHKQDYWKLYDAAQEDLA